MSQIEDFQSRITAAMARIGTGVEALASAPKGPDPAMVTELEEERQVNAQLQERLRVIKERHSAQLETLTREISNQSAAMARLDMDVQRLRYANEQLRDSNAALRRANEEGVGEPHLINKAMLAELESLRAARATDAAEAEAVLSRLEPLLTLSQTEPDEETA